MSQLELAKREINYRETPKYCATCASLQLGSQDKQASCHEFTGVKFFPVKLWAICDFYTENYFNKQKVNR